MPPSPIPEQPHVVVVGGANLDLKARSAAPVELGTSNPGSSVSAPGGVGRNIAENLARLGTPAYLVGVVGTDALGERLLAQTAAAGVRTELVHRTPLPTGTYTAVLDSDGELVVAIADMAATEALDPAAVDRAGEVVGTAGLVVLDGNLAPETLRHALDRAAAARARVVLEPVSVPKAARMRAALDPSRPVYAATPNRDELAALSGLPADTDDRLVTAARALHDRGVALVWVRLGEGGSVLSDAQGGVAHVRAFRAEVVDVTGAGDATLAGFCHALLAGAEPAAAARFGHAAAALTVASAHTVRPDLTEQLVRAVLDDQEPAP
jgi:pseudouridine kinase